MGWSVRKANSRQMAVRSGQGRWDVVTCVSLESHSAPRRARLRIEDIPFGREKGSRRHCLNFLNMCVA